MSKGCDSCRRLQLELDRLRQLLQRAEMFAAVMESNSQAMNSLALSHESRLRAEMEAAGVESDPDAPLPRRGPSGVGG